MSVAIATMILSTSKNRVHARYSRSISLAWSTLNACRGVAYQPLLVISLACSVFMYCFPYVRVVATPLNQFVSHFEPLNYDHQNLIWNHHRVRRSNIGPKEIELHIDAFGR